MKILIEALHGLGDLVCMLPMIKAVREKYPSAYIVIAVKFVACKELLVLSDIYINKIVVWNVYSDGLIKNYRNIVEFRKCKFDYLIVAANTPVKKAKLLSFLVKADRSLGIQFSIGKAYDDLGDSIHFVDAHLMAVTEELSLKNIDKIPHLFPDKDSLTFVENLISPIKRTCVVGVCIGSGDYSLKNRLLRTGKVFTKGWGIINLVELVSNLIQKDCGVVLIGGKLEEQFLPFFSKKLLDDRHLINCVNRTTISQSAALAEVCDVVIGVDTGMQHIASAVGAKTISIFGPTNPKRCGAFAKNAVFVEQKVACKYCYGTDKYVSCEDRECLKKIKVEDVLIAVNNEYRTV